MATQQIAVEKGKEGGKPGHAVFVAAFAAILCAGVLFRVLGVSGVEIVEKRALSSAPALPRTWQQWREFPAAFDQYARDHFGLRGELIALNSYLHFLLGVSSSPRVLVGNQGWLFYAGDGDWAFHRGANRMSGEQITAWLDRMEQRGKWLAERGIRFVILPAPVKPTIYPEILPFWLRRQLDTTITDQLVKACAARPGINLVDVRERLLQWKRRAPVYTPFDTHWNAEGAFVGYAGVMEKISPPIPGVAPLTRESIQLRPAPPERLQCDMVLMLGIDRFLNVQHTEYVPRHAGKLQVQYLTARTDTGGPQFVTTGVPNTARAMLIRDSFSIAMLPYFEDTFGSLLLTHVQDGSFPQGYIEQYHPDVVILEVQEAGLGWM